MFSPLDLDPTQARAYKQLVETLTTINGEELAQRLNRITVTGSSTEADYSYQHEGPLYYDYYLLELLNEVAQHKDIPASVRNMIATRLQAVNDSIAGNSASKIVIEPIYGYPRTLSTTTFSARYNTHKDNITRGSQQPLLDLLAKRFKAPYSFVQRTQVKAHQAERGLVADPKSNSRSKTSVSVARMITVPGTKASRRLSLHRQRKLERSAGGKLIIGSLAGIGPSPLIRAK